MSEVESLKVKRNLTALIEFSRVINSSLELEFILNNVLLTCLGKFLAIRGLVALKENNKFSIKLSKGIPQDILSTFPDVVADKDCEMKEKLNEFFETAHLKICEHINSSVGCIGFVCLGEKLNGKEYTDDDREFLKTILNIAATAIQNSLVVQELKKVNRELDSRIQRLNSLFELSKEFGLFSDSTKVSRLLVYSLMGQFLVSTYAILNFEGSAIQVLESKFPIDELLSKLRKYDYQKIETPLNRTKLEKSYPELFEIGIQLIVPMQIQGKVKGLIILGKRVNNLDYSDYDIEFIYSVGSLAIISLENRRLFKEALEKQKLQEELEFAREIQQNLLPSQIPTTNNFDIAAINLPSKQVGGDYFDIIKVDEGKYIIAIADVSGKGIPASLLMANMQAFLQVISKQNIDIATATGLINDLITQNTSDGRFITFFWALLDDNERKLTYVNAGHNPPILIRNDKIIRLSEGGIILGVMKTIMPYNSNSIELESGDKIIMFTDGVSEAMNPYSQEFSEERLEKIALSTSQFTSNETLQKIREEIEKFVEGAPQSDDLTMMIIRVR
ncbi:Serine phosphatase RsbU subunit sigma [Ignavibacterium album JCM 16511]|uniref:Serine phosphatase RsbU subunit sigma n=1 Tax=Ignavibacterium album (strain DSM 19864 / JCM 16511 / NBRC 101810 / Mat9-16) TaxID=945713 RepID=I0AHT5_IGNAJ|nr:SpoIIE family protein phosphatase [Ignavibacterium album]AFH48542.1 Serine phosphatase RsbU subunit sigma [Ignavibacterium album JCM 16511]